MLAIEDMAHFVAPTAVGVIELTAAEVVGAGRDDSKVAESSHAEEPLSSGDEFRRVATD